MATPLPVSRRCWLYCCAALAAAVAFPSAGRSQEFVEIAARTADSSSSRKITVQMWVIEVSTDKLRNLGFDWSQITARHETKTQSIDSGAAVADAVKNMGAEQFLGFLRALEKNNLARILAEPTIATRSGRQASLAIGEQLKLDVTPTAINDKHLLLQYRLELGGDPAASSVPLIAGSTVQVDPRKPCLVSQTRSSWQTAGGKLRQTETLLLVQADDLTAEAAAK